MSISVAVNQNWDYKTDSNSWTNIASWNVLEGRTVTLDAHVYAYAPGNEASFASSLRAMLRRNAGQDLQAVFSTVFDLLNTQKTLDALLWDARIRLVDDIVYLDVKGASSTDVYWTATGLLLTLKDESNLP